ncbi:MULTISPECIES: hypothetical protein [unclassified Erythrobacter]|uniref:hypothetical protein n=1 Tax=unclassified Erythrobacter TaxID=2633097 RepID=UPI0007B807F9|nr:MULTISPECIES: hypothetical protein [unclassified Erythrobacter]KZY94763.1 hypothetical protein A3745_09625 [Erythrobacter sp. HI0074]KZZ05482.1 hypothetical protein A3748_05125 [Erythrobacter sp. HI0077]
MKASNALLDAASLRERLRFANSFTRLPRLLDLADQCVEADWLRVLGEEWSVCDNIGQMLGRLIDHSPFGDVVDWPFGYRSLLMNEAETAALVDLPENFTIWRGCYQTNQRGLSWSLDRDLASRFPTLHRYRQDGQPLLIEAVVQREEVIALKLDRSEAEIVAWCPEVVRVSAIG